MKKLANLNINLAAPCGIYCGNCRHYLARAKDMLAEKKLKQGCSGCRVQNKNCAFIKKGCALVRKGEVTFCFECDNFPCENLKKLNERHVKDYNVNLIINLMRIKEIGVVKWLDNQEELWTCPECGGNLCVMDRECYDCKSKF